MTSHTKSRSYFVALKIAHALAIPLIYVGAFLIVENFFWYLNEKTPTSSKTFSQNFYDYKTPLAFRPVASSEIIHTYTYEKKQIWSAKYTTDQFHRRVVPFSDSGAPTKHLLFLGDSFTWGEGVNDNETLPFLTGQALPHYRPYDYGFPSYGPQHVLEHLRREDIQTEVLEKEGIAIYTFITESYGRLLPSFIWYYHWPPTVPKYYFDSRHQLARTPNFKAFNPLRTQIYEFFLKSNLIRYLMNHFEFADYPFYYTNTDYELVARVLEESKNTYQQKFGTDNFFVLFYPGTKYLDRLIPYLKKARVKYLDYRNLFDANAPQYNFGYDDGHPTPAAYKLLANQIARDLK